MYRLTVVAGPKRALPERGSSFAMASGEISIGRQSQNEIVLQSNNVSKRHCVLVVDNTKILLKDQGSSNGTYVNGKLAAQKELRPGDRIGVGEFVLELSSTAISRAVDPSSLGRAAMPERSNVLAFPNLAAAGGDFQTTPHAHAPDPAAGESASDFQAEPQSVFGKLQSRFEKYVMPYFYGLNERYEWRFVFSALVLAFVVLNLTISISPLMSSHEKLMELEIQRRAQVIAREIAERNTPALAARQETKTEIGSVERAEGVQAAVIVDLDGRILAPPRKSNEYFTQGGEANFLARAKLEYAKGEERGVARILDGDIAVAIEPIKVLNPALGRNQVVALALVALSTAAANADSGEMSLVYAHALILACIVAFAIFYVLYRVTVHPFETMNRKIDKAMRGEAIELKFPVHFSELNALWDVVDSAMRRIPQSSGGGDLGGGAPVSTFEDFRGPLTGIAQLSKSATAVLDDERKIVFLNAVFEEVVGIRSEGSQGQSLGQVARDQAFASLVGELFDRAQAGSEGASEDFDFSGLSFKAQLVAFGGFGAAKAYLLTLVRNE